MNLFQRRKIFRGLAQSACDTISDYVTPHPSSPVTFANHVDAASELKTSPRPQALRHFLKRCFRRSSKPSRAMPCIGRARWRWLLSMHDRAKGEISPSTHGCAAHILGTHPVVCERRSTLIRARPPRLDCGPARPPQSHAQLLSKPGARFSCLSHMWGKATANGYGSDAAAERFATRTLG
jgi:hypothetical protein